MTTAPFTSSRSFTSAPAERPAATERQVSFLRSLLRDRVWETAPMGHSITDVAAKLTPGLGAEYLLRKDQASAAIDFLLTCPRVENETPSAAPAPEVESGRYAVDLGGKLRFFHVQSPTSGRWAGYTFIQEQAGPEAYRVRSAAERRNILAAITADPEALARYGKELGICGRCGRELTDETSRQLGIGPVCRSK